MKTRWGKHLGFSNGLTISDDAHGATSSSRNISVARPGVAAVWIDASRKVDPGIRYFDYIHARKATMLEALAADTMR